MEAPDAEVRSACIQLQQGPEVEMVNWLYYPRSRKAPPLALKVVEAFRTVWEEVDSSRHNLPSNGVLAVLAPHLAALGFRVEVGKTRDGKIQVPVLFGLNGLLEKSFEADAYHEAEGMHDERRHRVRRRAPP